MGEVRSRRAVIAEPRSKLHLGFVALPWNRVRPERFKVLSEIEVTLKRGERRGTLVSRYEDGVFGVECQKPLRLMGSLDANSPTRSVVMR